MEQIKVVFLHRLDNKIMSGELVKVTDHGSFLIKAHDHRFYWVGSIEDIRWVETYEELKKYEDPINWKNDYTPYDV
jgi:hypothetical protein